jgi:hypothetical protein
MGVQCNIILTYYTESKWDYIREKINGYLGSDYIKENDWPIESPAGDRAWGPTDLQTHVICMKNWEESECFAFFVFLKTMEWDFPETVQIYYAPASFKNYELFKCINLFVKP